MTLTLFFN